MGKQMLQQCMHSQDAGHKTKENLRSTDELWVMQRLGERDLNV
jgi:hypothetical protein